jgi:hypothetical protein
MEYQMIIESAHDQGEEQIIGFLKQAEHGQGVKELCRLGGFSEASFYNWRAKYDRLDARVITRFGASSAPEPWQPPAPEVRHRQALLSRQEAIAQDLQRETNRKEKWPSSKSPPWCKIPWMHTSPD